MTKPSTDGGIHSEESASEEKHVRARSSDLPRHATTAAQTQGDMPYAPFLPFDMGFDEHKLHSRRGSLLPKISADCSSPEPCTDRACMQRAPRTHIALAHAQTESTAPTACDRILPSPWKMRRQRQRLAARKLLKSYESLLSGGSHTDDTAHVQLPSTRVDTHLTQAEHAHLAKSIDNIIHTPGA